MLKSYFWNCHLDLWYFLQNPVKQEWLYKVFENELLVKNWWSFLFQMIFQVCFCLKDFETIVSYFWPLLALKE